jgi:hypothetical protein|tara:strand:- start:203 stop:493 length:291 start_codon:yes stop_codon:yes gene_type:complete
MARIGRRKTIEWIKEDYTSNPFRFVCEVIGMISNLIASLILMWYSPNPPMFVAYIFFLVATCFLMYGAFSRKSFGFTVMYLVYLAIDGIGFIKTLL